MDRLTFAEAYPKLAIAAMVLVLAIGYLSLMVP